MNARMPELKRAFELAGFTEVKTLLSSGNVLFTASGRSIPALERKAEAAMGQALERAFLTIIRPVETLRQILESDPFKPFRLAPGTRRVITFMREAPATCPALPVALGQARILAVRNTEIFTVYRPGSATPDFMTLIEKTFGKEVTTRTWETVGKAAR